MQPARMFVLRLLLSLPFLREHCTPTQSLASIHTQWHSPPLSITSSVIGGDDGSTLRSNSRKGCFHCCLNTFLISSLSHWQFCSSSLNCVPNGKANRSYHSTAVASAEKGERQTRENEQTSCCRSISIVSLESLISAPSSLPGCGSARALFLSLAHALHLISPRQQIGFGSSSSLFAT